MLNKNVLANYLGQAYTAIIGIIFIPIYIKYVGIEAYGLIGLFTVIQSWLVLLDLGISPTLSREMGKYTGGEYTNQHIKDLLRSIEIIVLGITLFFVIIFFINAGWIANSWIKIDKLTLSTIKETFTIMSFVIGLRFFESIYHSCLIGLQKQVLYNLIIILLITLRSFGAILVLEFFSPTIQAFFIWQFIVSILSVMILIFATYFVLPKTSRRGKFSFEQINRIKKFSLGILIITGLATLLTQTDKLLLSKILSLTDYSYYIIATSIASTIILFINPIIQAFYPYLNKLYTQKREIELIEKFHFLSQLTTIISGSISIIFIFFSKPILKLWLNNNDMVNGIEPILSIYAIGSLINGLMYIPYHMQLVYGWTKLSININIISVLILIPSIIIFTPIYGAIGSAFIWIILNCGYMFIGINFMYKKILIGEKYKWYINDIFIPLGAVFIVAFIFKAAAPINMNSIVLEIFYIIITFLFTLSISSLFSNEIRKYVLKYFEKLKLNK